MIPGNGMFRAAVASALNWSARYVGLPWRERGLTREGIACWGLVRLVYAERLGLVLPDYAAQADTADRAAVAGVYASGTAAHPWIAVDPTEARSFDVVVFRVGALDAHAGVFVEPGRMLHITSGQESCIERYTTGRWAPRLSGVYRHHKMTREAAA